MPSRRLTPTERMKEVKPHARGLMVVNAFLKTSKFDDIYHTLLAAARDCGMELSVRTNAELCCIVDTPAFDSARYDFVLFWDKDVQLGHAA